MRCQQRFGSQFQFAGFAVREEKRRRVAVALEPDPFLTHVVRDNQVGCPEVNIGFIPAMVMAILRRSVSEKRAFELITMGEVISSQTAFEIGLINRLFSDETFDIDVEAYASTLAAKPSSAIKLSKNLLYHMDGLPFEAAIQSGVHMNAIARMTDDCKSGIERFLEKQ